MDAGAEEERGRVYPHARPGPALQALRRGAARTGPRSPPTVALAHLHRSMAYTASLEGLRSFQTSRRARSACLGSQSEGPGAGGGGGQQPGFPVAFFITPEHGPKGLPPGQHRERRVSRQVRRLCVSLQWRWYGHTCVSAEGRWHCDLRSSLARGVRGVWWGVNHDGGGGLGKGAL